MNEINLTLKERSVAYIRYPDLLTLLCPLQCSYLIMESGRLSKNDLIIICFIHSSVVVLIYTKSRHNVTPPTTV